MLKLDYVSPLPPVRSGIADYSVDLLPHLAERADVRVLVLPGQPVAEDVAARWRPVPAVEALAEIGAGDGLYESGATSSESRNDGLYESGAASRDGGRLPLYQMGNNPHHDAVWDLALRYPGILTLHDLVLHHLLAHRTLGQGRYEPYREALTADHGWIGREAARMRYWRLEDDASLFGLPAHGSLLLRQRGVLVHNRWAAERILEDIPDLRVRTIPMGIPLPAAAEEAGAGRAAAAAELRRSWGVPEGAPLLGSFGFQTPIKRTGSVIRALADPRLAAVHLVIVGESSPGLDLAADAREAGVADRVHVTGFVPYEAFEAAIAAVDLTLNLRYPTAGETSASLLRILALGRPAVVSDYGQFAELPDDVVVKVPLPGAVEADGDEARRDGGEAEALAAELSRLLAAPESLAAMGRAAREHVAREHDPARAAEALVAVCREWRHAEPLDGPRAVAASSGAPPTRLPPTSRVWPELPGELRVEGAEAPWSAGERRRLTVHLTNTGTARWLAADRGPGGLALEAVLQAEAPDLPRPWLPLAADVAPGESATFRLHLRRPPGPVRLHLAARVLDAPDARTPTLTLDL